MSSVPANLLGAGGTELKSKSVHIDGRLGAGEGVGITSARPGTKRLGSGNWFAAAISFSATPYRREMLHRLSPRCTTWICMIVPLFSMMV
ncbi:protein of unknown function [Kyrpidia spormannii]|uniref:Uncharacterized protein n=1 Tax=Kyrpidia spormannii TaxID=2055160 RepID=A0ACA8ZCV7_9BACL|nr:protein of unknown function [Kyrpidia spormannii]